MGKRRRVADSREKGGREEIKDARKLIRLSRERWGGKTADGGEGEGGGKRKRLGLKRERGAQKDGGNRGGKAGETKRGVKGGSNEDERSHRERERDGGRVRESIGLLIPPPLPERVGCALYTVLPVLPASARARVSRALTHVRVRVSAFRVEHVSEVTQTE